MKNTLKIDFANSKIVMDRTFAKKCENTASEEYARLQRVRADYPAFAVVRKQIKRKPEKETYKGLTYAYMEHYISLHDDEERTIRKEYDNLRLISECHRVRYPVIKKWFLEKFPEVAQFGVEPQEEEEMEKTSNVTLFPGRGVAETATVRDAV